MEELQQQITLLQNELEDLRFLVNRKIGGGSADIRGNLVGGTVSGTIGSGAISYCLGV